MNRRGFYLAGDFSKGRAATFMILSNREKPFKVDLVAGVIEPKIIRSLPRNFVVTEWAFFEGYLMQDINTDKGVRDAMNATWHQWCAKHKRRYQPICLPMDGGTDT